MFIFNTESRNLKTLNERLSFMYSVKKVNIMKSTISNDTHKGWEDFGRIITVTKLLSTEDFYVVSYFNLLLY